MPSISKIRFTNVVYEGGGKRYNDDIFLFDSHNGAILLENGGGKTVFIQTAIQAILPNVELAERKMKDTLSLESSSAHIAIEWIINERPRRYGLTAVTLYMAKEGLKSYRYTYEYSDGDKHRIEKLPFIVSMADGKVRPANRDEMNDYYTTMKANHPLTAHTFDTVKSYHQHLEERFKIIASEWKKITVINSSEGGVESFFDGCKTTSQLVDQLLIPTVEEALAGKGSSDFVQTFEKQREHFKAHKRLRRVIEENRQVEKQIAGYVSSFEHVDQAEKRLEEQKIKAKALYQFTQQEQSETKSRLTDLGANLDHWENEQREWQRKDKSYELAVLEKKRDEANEKFAEEKAAFDRLVAAQTENEMRLSQLKVAKVNKELQANEQLQHHFKNQLDLLEKDDESVELEARLKENAAFLKGYFIEEEKKIQQNVDQVKHQQERKREDRKEAEKELEEKQTFLKDLQLHEREMESQKNYYENDMQEIANTILSNPLKERVEDELPKWEKKAEQLDQEIISFQSHMKQLAQEKQELQEVIPNVEKAFQQAHDEVTTYKHQLQLLQDTQAEVLEELKVLKPQWAHYESIYEKEETILHQIEEKVERLLHEKEVLFYKERQATRFSDDYENNTSFTADPKLERWKDSWRNQFHYLELGTNFVQQAARTLETSEEAYYDNYRYWAITFVVSETEVTKLRDKLQSVRMELTHPVYICTEEEARTLIQTSMEEKDNKVFPNVWKDNLSAVKFKEWKAQVQQEAVEAKYNRTNKETELHQWNTALTKLREFLTKYSYDHYTELKEQLATATDEEVKQKRTLHEINAKLLKIDEELHHYRSRLTEAMDIHNGLLNKMKEGRKYFSKKKELEFVVKQLRDHREKLQEADRHIQRMKKLVSGLKEEWSALDEQLKEASLPLYSLHADLFYKEVAAVEPKFTSKSYGVLVSERHSLKKKLEDKQEGRDVIETQLKTAETKTIELQKELKLLEVQYGNVEPVAFPAHGEDEIERLSIDIQHLKEKIHSLSPRIDELQSHWMSAKEKFNIREADFLQIYQEREIFQTSLAEIREQLDVEKEKLQARYAFLVKEQKRHQSNDEAISKAIVELEKYDVRFAFLHEDVRNQLIDDETKQNYAYERMNWITRLVVAMTNAEEQMRSRKKQLNTERSSFIRFCTDTISDIKLRQTCISGIEYKETYEHVIEWQEKMKDRINRTVLIAEEDIREHDKQLQQFIAHLHLYLRTITDELRLIPKQTRVKVDDKSKDIYVFSVPEWDEQEGKEELRRHIDWMVLQLEKDEFKDDEGKEDESLIRKQIEKWLHTKQLLKNVMKEKDISVKCRKVSNDGKVSGALTSWEKSNAWSGGEKWSKNMTLFLGILNYLAEKRVPLQGNQKRHRTVIVDNPFGKASSDHVLDPVFFIAEQLGFQIIALTAHAEGKFIRKYFPVIYSCRLRESASGETLIMTKQKEIRTAFFKDHDPEAMARLGEQEQLALF
ncbi:hypothetical protein [Alkalihalobacterium chitinilyticum]|uniref:Chromosome segregation ATPase n=1 Tax=Alkalihalobacterium chitinilyticum TaxID=2980103 RepID=A0ABT5VP49_9BACI|nr:hypothetical protein [Alkalihalobacterium chitinilyticum]MDE5416054.1 hypothetical protein [Alkalihalobacterium chitinilyticum]